MGPKVHYTADGVTAVCGAADTELLSPSTRVSPHVEYRSYNLDRVNCGACDAIVPLPAPKLWPPPLKS
jgi:hypothetical protein